MSELVAVAASTFSAASPFEELEFATGAGAGWLQAPNKANAPIRHEEDRDRRFERLCVAEFCRREGEHGMGIRGSEVRPWQNREVPVHLRRR